MHHFTQADQVNQLVSASEADPDLGFMARLMALCSLPRTNPGDRKEYKRVNGPYTLYMTAGRRQQAPLRQLAASVAGVGVAPKRCGPKAVCWSWEPRSRGSCASLDVLSSDSGGILRVFEPA